MRQAEIGQIYGAITIATEPIQAAAPVRGFSAAPRAVLLLALPHPGIVTVWLSMNRLARTCLGLVSAMSAIAVSAEPQEKEVQGPLVPVGLAREDITPEVPIRLCGYPGRTAEATSVGNHLWARAMAIGADPASGGDPSQQPVVMITVELIGITSAISDAVADELWQRHGIARAHVAVCATHVHTGPMLEHLLSNMYGKPLPADQLERVRRYSETLTARLKAVAEAALADRRPSRLGWGQG